MVHGRGVRVLGIETSSERGTLSLVENGVAVVTESRIAAGKLSEHLIAMLGAAFAEAGWSKGSVDRIAAGVGPGSFTGIRVGLAFAEGIALGLDRPLLGIGALRAMCRGVPPERTGMRCAVVDARRNDVFLAAYDASGVERVAPRAVARAELARAAVEFAASSTTWVGELTDEVESSQVLRSPLTDLPHALCVALLGAELDPRDAPAEAAYVRPPDARHPDLPQSPLSLERKR